MSPIYDALNRVEKPAPIRKIGSETDVAPASAPEPVSLNPAASARTHDVRASSINRAIDEDELAQCPLNTWVPDTSMLFFGSEELGHGREEFRRLRARLYQLRETRPVKSILVTSALPGEGRSFTAANLAQVMARQQGCRALLIDADLRSPSLHKVLGTSPSPGLSEFLLGDAKELEVIQRGQMENLFFIPAGPPVTGQTELICNGRLRILLNGLESLFEWIIIDSPAAIPVSDSVVMANFCDGVLIIVRSNLTPFDVVRKTRQRFPDEHVLGVVLNGTAPDPHLDGYYRASGAEPGTADKED